jgi:site-specific DNA-methyltransferase (adenine-specific)
MNTIDCGDCISKMRDMENDSVEMTLTDIPYDVVNRSSNGIRNFDKTDADDKTFNLDIFVAEVVRVTKGSIYIFCSTEQVSFLRAELIKHGLTTRLCIWEKTNPSPVNGQYIWLSGVECCVYGRKKKSVFNEHCKNTVWRYPVVRKQHHPTQKPLELFQYLIRVSSNPGDVIFDPCLGSGTTAIAAVKEKRRFIAFELNCEYAAIAKKRVEETQLLDEI